jgi:hypothetical protein
LTNSQQHTGDSGNGLATSHWMRTCRTTSPLLRSPYDLIEKRFCQDLTCPATPSRPTVGDVVASRPTARADLFAIAIVPDRGELVPACYDRALIARTSARERAVDGWYTCDHAHYAGRETPNIIGALKLPAVDGLPCAATLDVSASRCDGSFEKSNRWIAGSGARLSMSRLAQRPHAPTGARQSGQRPD